MTKIVSSVIVTLSIAVLVACKGGTEISEIIQEKPQNQDAFLKLIVTYDNNPYDKRLKTAWGFSCLVRLKEKSILFDTGGDSSRLLFNMEQLEIDPKEVSASAPVTVQEIKLYNSSRKRMVKIFCK